MISQTSANLSCGYSIGAADAGNPKVAAEIQATATTKLRLFISPKPYESFVNWRCRLIDGNGDHRSLRDKIPKVRQPRIKVQCRLDKARSLALVSPPDKQIEREVLPIDCVVLCLIRRKHERYPSE